MKILLCVDGSPHSDAAVQEVAARPWPPASTVRVLTAVREVAILVPLASAPTLMASGPDPRAIQYPDIQEAIQREAQRVVDSAAKTLRDAGHVVETVIRSGDPRSAVVDEAREWGADLIVMGSRGLSGVKRWLLGSVAQSVVSHAPCSVQVVRARAPDAAPPSERERAR